MKQGFCGTVLLIQPNSSQCNCLHLQHVDNSYRLGVRTKSCRPSIQSPQQVPAGSPVSKIRRKRYAEGAVALTAKLAGNPFGEMGRDTLFKVAIPYK